LLIKVNTLKYLIKGGRLSYTKGLIARLLHLNPVLSLDETGKVIVLEKSFSPNASRVKIINYIKKILKSNTIWNYIVLHANNFDDAEWYTSKMIAITGKQPVAILNISPVIGAHAGTGASAIALMTE